MTGAILDAGRIVTTVERLRARIAERFPQSGLAEVGAGLAITAQATAARIALLTRPDYALRALAVIVVILGLAAQIYIAHLIDWRSVLHRADPVGITQGLDAVVNLLLLAFGAIWFVLTLEQRLKRRRVLRALYELRSLAHVIDMHQLTKDPSVILSGATPTASSPERRMNAFELSRYLDYCTEMLALIAKLAALYAGHTHDPEVMSAVREVEALTSDLGRKIWQKIMI
ncbi:MAG TPA: hypothetical protein VHU87_03475, partial [Rhizomicrobium sp.]|nr:hypothetical protein [Rhizomicrobium sp.]